MTEVKDHFEFGEAFSILDLPKEEAIKILGELVYNAAIDCGAIGLQQKGRFRVASVNREERSITLEWEND